MLAALFTTSCKEVMGSLDNPVKPYLEIETADMELLVGQDSLRPATTISTEKVKYTSSDENVAIVDETGKVTAKAVGTATITASVPKTADGIYLAGEQQYTVNVVKVGVTFDSNEATMWTDQWPQAPREVAVTHKKAVLTFVSDNTDVATVDPTTGVVTPVGGGVANISVDVAYGDFYFEEAAASYQLTVYNYIWLPNFDSDVVVHNYDQIGGNGEWNHKITIADGATVFFHQPMNINNPNGNAVACEGDATIVLQQPGTTYTLQSANNYAGLAVGPEGKTLTIKGEGTLNVTGGSEAAGIGTNYKSICGNIVVESGTIIANSNNYGAGIGAGDGGTCGNITIKGGTITATGGNYAAGIGTGDNWLGAPVCGNITITGGTVTAKGGSNGAGIGTGIEEKGTSNTCGNITISGGTVTATGRSGSYDIGPGFNSAGGTITVGTINVTVAVKDENGNDANIYNPNAPASAPRRAAVPFEPAPRR